MRPETEIVRYSWTEFYIPVILCQTLNYFFVLMFI